MSKPVELGEGPARVAQEIAGIRRQLDYIEKQMDADLGLCPEVDVLANYLVDFRIYLAERLAGLRYEAHYSKASESNPQPDSQR